MERVCTMSEGELPPIDAGKRPMTTSVEHTVKVRRVRIMKRLRDATGTSPEMVRNGVILKEMRESYNRLTGVGDNLVDTRLSELMPHHQGVGSLGKQDMFALNYDLASLASAIFGPIIAQRVYDHIGQFITETFA